MRNRVLNTVTLLALAGLSSLAMGQSDSGDPPALVGRVAVTQGQVSIGSDVGAEMMAAQVNWPVTSGNTISTAPGARTALRIGSTSIRLDGDSSLEVVQLDDANLRLRLHYGSANIRVRNPDLVPGFELTTPEARVRLEQPSSLRIDAERVRDTSSVDVFDGVALVDGGGSQLTIRAGKGAELTDDDVRTLAATRDGFDDWATSRDRIEDSSASARYVGTEMTGYEDLDRYGSWSTNSEYGPLWIPTVASGWVPYRDGSWTWLDPWGWTWVDNAPWGYAPFHYGRWVQVNSRWAWAPGRRPEHWVWAPALVGWVGGAGWNVTFRDRSRAPGTGWYPLSWHDRYVPGYRVPANHLRWMNEHVRDRKGGRDFRPQGLTVVPQDRFRQPGRVNVPRSPILTAPPVMAHNVPAALPAAGAPPAPPNRPQRPGRPAGERDGERRADNWRGEGRRGDARAADTRPDAGRPADARPAEIRPVDARQDADHAERGARWGGRGDDRRADGVIDTGRAERDGFANRRSFQAAMPAPVIGQATPSAQGLGINSPPPHQSQQAGTIVSPPPQPSPTPGTISSLPPRQPAPQMITTVPPAGVPPAGVPAAGEREREWRSQGWQRSDRREQLEELRRNRQPMPAPAPVLQTPSAPAAPAAPVAIPQPVREARTESRFEQRSDPRPERAHRGDWERPSPQRIAPPAPQAAPAPAPAPASAPVMMARPAMPAPPPVTAARPAPAPAAAPPAPRGDGGGRAARAEGGGGRHQQER